MELIIAIVLIGVLAAIGSSMFVDTFMTTYRVNADTSSVDKARYALERLAREIREIKYASSKTITPTYCSGTITDQYCITSPNSFPAPATPLDILAGGTLSFINATSGNTIIIAHSENNLTLNDKVLCDNVTGLTLTFYDSSDSASTPTKSTVRFVVIDLTVKDTAGMKGIQQRTRVALRNVP